LTRGTEEICGRLFTKKDDESPTDQVETIMNLREAMMDSRKREMNELD